MTHLSVVATALVASLGVVASSPAAIKCKADPSSSFWPRLEEWNFFNRTIRGQLIAPIPPAGLCHKAQKNYNEDQCHTLSTDWRKDEFHAADPVSVIISQYSNDTCLPDPNVPCSGAGYPAYVVDATTPDLIQTAVRFARKNSLRLIVKSTGHDYQGRSIAPGSLSIWVHHLNSIDYRPGAYTLTGSNYKVEGNFAVVGGGVQMGKLQGQLAEVGQVAVGGQSKTVSVGGYITSGGHSALSPLYGLAADNVIELQVVIPTGELITANKDVNSDIYWAVLGGGGSTFGVVVSYVIKTHPTPKVLGINLYVLVAPNDTKSAEIIGYLGSTIPDLMDAGLSGYGTLGPAIKNPNPMPGAPDMLSGFLGKFALFDKGDAELAAMVKNINDTLNIRFEGHVKLIYQTEEYPTYLDWFNVVFDKSPAGNHIWLVSRLLDKQSLKNEVPMGNAIWGAASDPQVPFFNFFLVGGKGVETNPGNSVNSAWRSTYVHTISGIGFPPFNKTASLLAAEKANIIFEPVRQLTPNTGAYVNEASHFEPDFQHTFWGSNYGRLLQIKRRVDPDDVFWCVPCVGNERWQEKPDGKLCRV